MKICIGLVRRGFLLMVVCRCVLVGVLAQGMLLLYFLFFYQGFFSRTLTNHMTAEEGGGHFFNSSLPIPPASQTLRH